MSWETAAVLLGILATIIVAIIKFMYPRRSGNSESSNPGRRNVNEAMCDERSGAIRSEITILRADVKEDFHDIKQGISKLDDNVQAILVELAKRNG